MKRSGEFVRLFVVISFLFASAAAQSSGTRILSGTVLTPEFQLIPNVLIEIAAAGKRLETASNAQGEFSIAVPSETITVRFYGKNLEEQTRSLAAADDIGDIRVIIRYVIPPIAESVTIIDDTLAPDVERRGDTIYKNGLFSRDDQLIQTLNAGINAGQHEGGGKSLEIRRFGYNLDHGGVNGGLKILVDDVQQNQSTQGHGQGYLGALKSLSPELVDDVTIVNGPFSAAYGDFSGLGVVHIRQKESLPQVFTARLQGGSFNTVRGFFAFSPEWKKLDAFIAYEPSYTDGPFINPLRYRRDNLTGNLTYKFSDSQAFGIKFNAGRNDFTSSGQIPLDLVAAGELDRFGFIDPENGGKVQLGTVAAYFRREFKSGATFKADAFVGRSLFDLFSNFTFFTADPIYGDEIQQHDSRLQEGANVQYLRPYKLFGTAALLTVGGNFHANQINVGLYPTVARDPSRKFLPGNAANPGVPLTSAHANVNNYASYVQNTLNFFNGHVRVDMGLRYDLFTFDVNGFEQRADRVELTVRDSQGKFQPKLAVAVSPFETIPLTFYVNYGRGISSQDARGIARDPDSPKLATTDFYQVGASFNARRVSATLSSFFIDRSNEQVYIPDDGSIELAGRSRSYGVEARTSVKLTRNLSFNGGLTQVIKAFYPGQFTADGSRVIIDSAPHLVANAGLVLSELRGFNGSLSWRHISNYRLDADDPSIRAGGNDVVDVAVSRRLTRWIDVNFAVDNLLNKKYFETQNYFESRACQSCGLETRIHATPGYPLTVTAGITFRFNRKN